MKGLFCIAATLFCFAVLPQANSCRNDCKDTNPRICPLVKALNQCNRLLAFCQSSCGICIPCSASAGGNTAGVRTLSASKSCKVGCRDERPLTYCAFMKYKFPKTCDLLQGCDATCGKCKGCPKPVPKTPCTSDCKDNDESCEYWKGKNYCKTSSAYYPYVSKSCPKSCGVCKTCPIPEPQNTALPPEPLACTKDCKDEMDTDTCKHWKSKNHCKESSKYPYVREVCAMTCKICNVCPTEAPNTALPPTDDTALPPTK